MAFIEQIAMAADDISAGVQEKQNGKYLTFCLAGEEYGIGIRKVKEIIGMMKFTSIPQMPGYIKGVINLRGKVIPVIDLRLKFGKEAISYTERTCVVVVEIMSGNGNIQKGIIVDSVSEVLNVRLDEIADVPTFGVTINTDYILGMAKMEGGVKLLLNIDRVFSDRKF